MADCDSDTYSWGGFVTVSKTTTTLDKAEAFRKAKLESTGDARFGIYEVVDFADSLTAELQKEKARLKGVCDEIQEIVLIYGEQAAEGCVDSPGGLENMGDVWLLLCKWDAALSKEKAK